MAHSIKKIFVDHRADVCPGVRRAIRLVEDHLNNGSGLVALGQLIHNGREVDRLAGKGLQTVDQDAALSHDEIHNGTPVFVRTHGIAPGLREKLTSSGHRLVDGTCSIVKKLQRFIAEKYAEGFQIIIYGKPGHPEVTGLLGYCNDEGVLIESEDDIAKVNTKKKSVFVSQTTMSQERFFHIGRILAGEIKELYIHDSTCHQINNKTDQVEAFAKSVDVLLFVGGRNSSNTKLLYSVCKNANTDSYHIESSADIDVHWFKDKATIGITGSASTPRWQMEEIKHYIENLPHKGKKINTKGD